jgi:hypothetical protein
MLGAGVGVSGGPGVGDRPAREGVLGALGVTGDFLIAFIVLVALVAHGCVLPWACDCVFDGDGDDDAAGGGKGGSGDVGAGAVILCTPAL